MLRVVTDEGSTPMSPYVGPPANVEELDRTHPSVHKQSCFPTIQVEKGNVFNLRLSSPIPSSLVRGEIRYWGSVKVRG